MNTTDCLKAVFNCTSLTPACHNDLGFDFKTLWNITVRYNSTCPDGPLLFKPSESFGRASVKYLALTNEACEAIAKATWRRYPGDAIWQRLTTWKFPLFQLLANSPRPPLGFWVASLTFVHLLGDPVGTISDLICKIDACQGRAVFWQDRLNDQLIRIRDSSTRSGQRRLWKAWTIIVDSFDEWGREVGDEAQEYLLAELTHLCLPDTKTEHTQQVLDVITKTANALAADRSTMSVPIIISQAFFIASIAVAMIRTKATGSGSSPTAFIQIEIYSIAFTAQFFWVMFAVCWTSIIGVSQTAAAIPHILSQFCSDIESSSHTQQSIVGLAEIVLQNKDQRIYSGGVYSWQPARRWWKALDSSSERRAHHFSAYLTVLRDRVWTDVLEFWPIFRYAIPFFVVSSASGTGLILSAFVPPEGWTARSVAMMWMLVTWLISYFLSMIPFPNRQRAHFWATFVKDFLITGVQFGIILVTQFGVYNRCNAYTRWGRVGLQLPFMPAVDDVLQSRLDTVYPTIVAVGIAVQLILFPGLLAWRYHSAVQVYLQRDDDDHHFSWIHDFRMWRRRRQR